MIYARWFGSVLLHLPVLLLSVLLAPLLSLATANGWPKWGVWFWTHDNPPQGDPVYRSQRCWFPNVDTGWRGYINRVQWLWRNPVYGLGRKLGVEHSVGEVEVTGNPDISDRRGIPGSYFATYRVDGKLQAFEYYAIIPWAQHRCLRIKLGWKIATRRFAGEQGYGILVYLVNPFMSYDV